MSKLRVAVYSIALNEAKFVERWVRSANDADYLLVADTGSTDATVALLEQHHVNCHSIRVRPFRFDDARNTALALLPADIDVAVSLDLDEVLTPNWRYHLEQSWQGNRLRYRYVWSWAATGKPLLTFYGDKIGGRFTHRWRHPVHEVLVPTGGSEVSCTCEQVLIEHHPDPQKSRGQYFELLKLATTEDPHDDRNAHYYAREYYWRQHWHEAIKEFQRHLALPLARWLPERAASMRYIAKCYHALGDLKLAHQWFLQATLEDEHSHEALIDAAAFMLSQNAFHAVIHYCERALALDETMNYMAEHYAHHEGPYDLMAVAYFHLGERERAIALAKVAVERNPTDERLHKNLAMMQA